jgi:hypothetical protein
MNEANIYPAIIPISKDPGGNMRQGIGLGAAVPGNEKGQRRHKNPTAAFPKHVGPP